MSLISSMVDPGQKKAQVKKKSPENAALNPSLRALMQMQPRFAAPGLASDENLVLIFNHKGDLIHERISSDPIPKIEGYSIQDAMAMQRISPTLKKTFTSVTKSDDLAKLVATSIRVGSIDATAEQEPARNFSSVVKPARQFLVNLKANMEHLHAIEPRLRNVNATADKGFIGMIARGLRDAETCLGERIFGAVTDRGAKQKALHELSTEVETFHSLITLLCKADWAANATTLDELVKPKKREAGIKVSIAEVRAGKLTLISDCVDKTFVGLANFLASRKIQGGFVEDKSTTTSAQRKQEQLDKVQFLIQYTETTQELIDVPKLQLPSVGTCVMYPALCRGLTTALYRMRAGYAPFGCDQLELGKEMAKDFVFDTKSSDSFRIQFANYVKSKPDAAMFYQFSPELIQSLIRYAGVGTFWPHHGIQGIVAEFKNDHAEREAKENAETLKEHAAFKCLSKVFPSSVENRVFLAEFKPSTSGVYPKKFQKYIPNYDPENEFRKRMKKGQKSFRVFGLYKEANDFLDDIKYSKRSQYKTMRPIVGDLGTLLTSIENKYAQSRAVRVIKAQWQLISMYSEADKFDPQEEFRSPDGDGNISSDEDVTNDEYGDDQYGDNEEEVKEDELDLNL